MVWSRCTNKTSYKFAGQLLIELLLTVGLLALITPPLIAGLIDANQTDVRNQERQSGVALLHETAEAVRSVRAKGWQFVATPGTYHPVVVNNDWSLVAGSTTIDGMTQEVVISNVSRDSEGTIVTSGGTNDPSTKRVNIAITSGVYGANTLTQELLLTRYLDNELLTDTTEAQFIQGTLAGTTTTNSAGGEVILATGGRGNWCLPNENVVAQYDLPQDGKAAVVRAIQGKIFTGTDYGYDGKFVELGISQADPPQITLEGVMNGYDTNDIFIDNNYAYVATDDVSKDIVIIDLNTNTEVGYFNDSHWWGTAQGVFVKGNVGYAVIGPNLHTFDLTSKAGVRPQLDSVGLSNFALLPATGYRVQVVGNYAYVALDWGSAEMRIVNVTNPSNISRAGSANVNSERGKDLFVNETGTRVFLITATSGSMRELFIINSTNKTTTSPQLIGSFDTNGMDPKGIAVVTGNKAIVVGTGGQEYQVVDITNEAAPSLCGSINLDTGAYGVAGVLESDGDAFSYLVTKENNAEIKVIEGGPGGQYANSGSFESRRVDFMSSAVFNYLSFNGQVYEGTTSLTYQVAGADPVSNSCAAADFTFVGPDKTSNTFFSTSGALPLDDDGIGYENPARCFRYKVFFTTSDTYQTPEFQQAVINYSP